MWKANTFVISFIFISRYMCYPLYFRLLLECFKLCFSLLYLSMWYFSIYYWYGTLLFLLYLSMTYIVCIVYTVLFIFISILGDAFLWVILFLLSNVLRSYIQEMIMNIVLESWENQNISSLFASTPLSQYLAKSSLTVLKSSWTLSDRHISGRHRCPEEIILFQC